MQRHCGKFAGLVGVSVIPVAIWTGGRINWRHMKSHVIRALGEI